MQHLTSGISFHRNVVTVIGAGSGPPWPLYYPQYGLNLGAGPLVYHAQQIVDLLWPGYGALAVNLPMALTPISRSVINWHRMKVAVVKVQGPGPVDV